MDKQQIVKRSETTGREIPTANPIKNSTVPNNIKKITVQSALVPNQENKNKEKGSGNNI